MVLAERLSRFPSPRDSLPIELHQNIHALRHVGFSFCLYYMILPNFLWNRIYFGRTQAFTNPTDLASSGVWENVFPAKTPGVDGVLRKKFSLQYVFNIAKRLPIWE